MIANGVVFSDEKIIIKPKKIKKKKSKKSLNKSWRDVASGKKISRKKKDKKIVVERIKVENYYLYLKQPHWIFRRYLYWSMHKKICEMCGGKASDIHHLNYKHLYGELDEDLMPVCRQCHTVIHDN
jgi:5-methylcytosine-specific restriction endonuclease McrA